MKKLLIALTTLMLPSAAIAQLPFPNWGLSPEEVKKFSDRPTRDSYESQHSMIPALVNLIDGIMNIEGHKFRVSYYFNKNSRKLALIEFTPPQSKQCEQRPAFYRGLFGEGEAKRTTFVAQSRNVHIDDIVWKIDDNRVLFFRMQSAENFGTFGCDLTLISPRGLPRLQILPEPKS